MIHGNTMDVLTTLIQNYRLHESWPVKLWPLEDIFPIRFDDLSMAGALAAILSPPDGWPAHAANRARVVIDYSVGSDALPMIYAHEIGHGICGHPGTSCFMGIDIYDKFEREAWSVASGLLIPAEVARSCPDTATIAAECGVAEWLVELWPF